MSNPPTTATAFPTKAPTPQPTQKSHAGAGVKGGKGGVGFQSNWGPSHTGSMVYDYTRHSVYVTGTTFETSRYGSTSSWMTSEYSRSSCFVGHVPIANIRQWKTVGDPLPPKAADNYGTLDDFVIPDSLDDREQMGCHAIYYDDSSETDDFLYVGGVDEPDAKEVNGTINALLNVYQRKRNHPDWELKILPRELENPTPQPADAAAATAAIKTPVRYPVAMTSGMDASTGNGEIIVVSVSSDDPRMSEEYIANGDDTNAHNDKNSLLPPGLMGGDPSHSEYFKRGSNFYLTYQMFEWVPDEWVPDETPPRNSPKRRQFKGGEDIKQIFNTDTDDGRTNIFPTGVGNLSPRSKEYVFVGHIQGRHPAQWDGMARNVDADGNLRIDDLDGFAATLVVLPRRLNLPSGLIRFSSVEMNPPLDDFVHDICMGGVSSDSYRVSAYYVVGSTYGTMSPGSQQQQLTTNILSSNDTPTTNSDGNSVEKLSAFVSKVDSLTMEVLWTTQLYAADNSSKSNSFGKTEAFGCHVISHDPSTMYVGGTVYDGAVMDATTKSAGSDDVWVAQLSTDTGALKWVKQIGSSGKDRISRTNGVQADMHGDCIIYGDTTGELYRPRSAGEKQAATSDIFVVKLDRDDGSYASTVELDRAATTMKNGIMIIIPGTVFILVSFCMCCYSCVFYKFRRRPARRPKNNDSKNNIDDAVDGLFSNDFIASFYRNKDSGSCYSDDNSDGNSNGNDEEFSDHSYSYSDRAPEQSHPNGNFEMNMNSNSVFGSIIYD